MPVELPIAVRMSRRFVCVNLRMRGSRERGFRIGGAEAALARSRSSSISGRGRAASMRARISWSSSVTFAAA